MRYTPLINLAKLLFEQRREAGQNYFWPNAPDRLSDGGRETRVNRPYDTRQARTKYFAAGSDGPETPQFDYPILNDAAWLFSPATYASLWVNVDIGVCKRSLSNKG